MVVQDAEYILCTQSGIVMDRWNNSIPLPTIGCCIIVSDFISKETLWNLTAIKVARNYLYGIPWENKSLPILNHCTMFIVEKLKEAKDDIGFDGVVSCIISYMEKGVGGHLVLHEWKDFVRIVKREMEEYYKAHPITSIIYERDGKERILIKLKFD